MPEIVPQFLGTGAIGVMPMDRRPRIAHNPTVSDSPIIDGQVRVYRPSFLEHGDDARATFNGHRAIQHLRFRRLMEPLIGLKRPFTLHDVGCGLCDLYGWLAEQGVEHAYTGTEIVSEMIDFARRKFPGLDVRRRDVLAEDVVERHDFVVQSGMFNMPGEVDRGAWQGFVEAMIERMYEMCAAATSFNFLTSYRTRTDPALHYIDPREMFDFCATRLSRFVTLDQGSPLFECTIAVFRPEFVRRLHAGPEFDRYFGGSGR